MFDKSLLKRIIQDQHADLSPERLVARQTSFSQAELTRDDAVVIITGVRRCGKSIFQDAVRSSQAERKFYLNFDDERLMGFSVDDFQYLVEVFIELYGEEKTYYFDEIQNIEGWERFVRRLHNQKNKVHVTGSNARMLSRELGTHLTGRCIRYELWPFSFTEFVSLRKQEYLDLDIQALTTVQASTFKKLFNEYMAEGGFPEFLVSSIKSRLTDIYEGIIYRDILARYRVANESAFRKLCYYLASNVGKCITYSSLKKVLEISSPTTVSDYCDYIENTYLAFFVSKHEYSLKKQMQNRKKVYFIDCALASIVGFRFSEDYGRFLENTIFLDLKRRNLGDIFYFSDKNECDFIIQHGLKVTHAIQVTQELNDENRKREYAGLIEAVDKLEPEYFVILTEDQEDVIEWKDRKIDVLPVWKWLLTEI